MLGLPRNVLVWDGEQLATWLDALGLSPVAPAFLAHNINGATASAAISSSTCAARSALVATYQSQRHALAGGTVFLLTEDHLRDLGLTVVGDRLYFIDLLTQLYDDIVTWSSAIGVQLATHPVPPLRKIGLSLQPTSWTVKDVCKVAAPPRPRFPCVAPGGLHRALCFPVLAGAEGRGPGGVHGALR